MWYPGMRPPQPLTGLRSQTQPVCSVGAQPRLRSRGFLMGSHPGEGVWTSRSHREPGDWAPLPGVGWRLEFPPGGLDSFGGEGTVAYLLRGLLPSQFPTRALGGAAGPVWSSHQEMRLLCPGHWPQFPHLYLKDRSLSLRSDWWLPSHCPHPAEPHPAGSSLISPFVSRA